MTLNKEELLKLQKLAAIDLSENEQEDFLKSLWEIIKYLDIMKDADSLWDLKMEWVTGNFLQPREWVKDHDDTNALLKNVEHEVVWNSISIKSFVKKDEE